MLEPPYDERRRQRQDRDIFSMQMGALYWLAQKYEALPDHDPEVVEIINRVLHSEPRVIASDITRFRRRHLRGDPSP
jgi:hypothetical protein